MMQPNIFDSQIIRLHQFSAQRGRIRHCLFKIIAFVDAQLNADACHIYRRFPSFYRPRASQLPHLAENDR